MDAADVLPGLVDAAAVAAVMRDVGAIIEACATAHGLACACKFSGVYLAVAPDWADHRADLDPHTRAVNCVRAVHCQLSAYSARAGIHVVISAGLSSGPVTLGFVGNSRISFDATGSAVSLALAMVRSYCIHPYRIHPYCIQPYCICPCCTHIVSSHIVSTHIVSTRIVSTHTESTRIASTHIVSTRIVSSPLFSPYLAPI